MACNSWGGIVSPGYNQGRPLLQLCISDRNKEMLIACPGFIAHVLSSLMLDPDHARQSTPQIIKDTIQRHYSECLQQISLFPAGCQALKAHPGVVQALDVLAVKGWTDAAKQSAQATLFETCPERINHKSVEQPAGGNGTEPDGHVFISYQWVRALSVVHSFTPKWRHFPSDIYEYVECPGSSRNHQKTCALT